MKRVLAAWFSICPRTVDNLIVRGMPHVKLGARKTLFDLNEVEAWLKQTYGVSRLGKLDASKGEVVK